MKLVFAGLGRTGTTSLVKAMEILGLSVLAQEKLFRNRKAHRNVNDSLRGKADLDPDLFSGIDVTIGWPLCFLIKEQLDRFPDAHCILNVREPERWFDSVERTWEQIRILRKARYVPKIREINATLDYIQERFGGAPEKKRWIEAYHNHIALVKSTVPPDRLTVYQIHEGWDPLCEILGIPVPEEAFPVKNTGKSGELGKKLKNLFGIGS